MNQIKLVGGNADIHERMDDEGAAFFDGLMRRLAENAYQAQGLAAFDYPRKDAAIHEAGHAVWDTANGLKVTRCKIWQINDEIGRRQWIGITDNNRPATRHNSDSRPEDDLNYARCVIAGIAAETLFLGDEMRAGSALDEWALFQMLCGQAFLKLGSVGDVVDFFERQKAIVETTLKHNSGHVSAIADALMRHGSLKGKRLQTLLAPIEPRENRTR